MGRAGSSFLASGWGNKGRRLRFSESRSLEEWSCGAGVPICQRDLCSSAAATSEGSRRLDGSPGQSWLPEPAAVPGSTPMRAAAIQEGAAFFLPTFQSPSRSLCVCTLCVSWKKEKVFPEPQHQCQADCGRVVWGERQSLTKGQEADLVPWWSHGLPDSACCS